MRKASKPVVSANVFAYQRIAGSLLSLIEAGALRAGDRLPSIRHVCRTERVSPATALQAFAELERLGRVEVRDRSGHYVLASGVRAAPQPAMTSPDAEPTRVGVSDEVEAVFRSAGDKRVVPLGAAIPAPELLPGAELARHLAVAARGGPGLLSEYSFAPALPAMARELSRRYGAQGCVVPPEDFTITAGGMEALNLAIRAVTRPGDIVAVESPGYFGLLQILESLGLKALPIPTTCEHGIDLAALRAALEDHPVKALVFVPSFSNPTGACLSDERRRELAAMLDDFGVPLVEDDIYGELYFGAARPRPVRAWDKGGRVLLCGSFSKCLSPGLRIGWVAGGSYTERIRRLKHITSVNTPAAIQSAVAAYMATNRLDRHLRRLRRSFQEQVWATRQAVLRAFPEGTAVSDPRGGCFLWVQLPAGVDARALHAAALERGIGIAPGPIFCPLGNYGNFIRVGCGVAWTPRIAVAVETLGQLARAAGRRAIRVKATAG